MDDTVRVGLIGYGLGGKSFHAPFIAATPGVKLVAVGSSDPDKVHRDWPDVRVHSDPGALIEAPDVDLVVVSTPNDSHAALARRALQAGKPVVLDKPMTETLAEAEELVALAQSKGLLLSVFHNRRWDADFLTLKQLLAEGRVGRPVLLESRFDRFRPGILGKWREQAGIGAGVWYDLGPHMVDQALQLFGAPETVWADIDALRDGAASDDDFLVVLGYPRLKVLLRSGSLVGVRTARFTLLGDQGAWIKFGMDPQEAAVRGGARPGGEGWGVDPEPGILTLGGDPATAEPVAGPPGDYRLYYAGIRDALLGKGPNPVSPEEALQVMRILELARESSSSGRRLAAA